MTDAQLAERIWTLTLQADAARAFFADLLRDLHGAGGEGQSVDPSLATFHSRRLRETEDGLRDLLGPRYEAMAADAGLTADNREAIRDHYRDLADRYHTGHLLGSLRHLLDELDRRESRSFATAARDIAGLRGDPDPRDVDLKEVYSAFDEVSKLVVALGQERPVYPEGELNYGSARNHWLRLRRFVADTIAGFPPTPTPPPSDSPASTSPSPPAGFSGVRSFRFGGVDVDFGRATKEHKLVEALWDDENQRPSAARKVDDVITAVYGEGETTLDGTFRKLVSSVRDRFLTWRCPLTIELGNGLIQLSTIEI